MLEMNNTNTTIFIYWRFILIVALWLNYSTVDTQLKNIFSAIRFKSQTTYCKISIIIQLK